METAAASPVECGGYVLGHEMRELRRLGTQDQRLRAEATATASVLTARNEVAAWARV